MTNERGENVVGGKVVTQKGTEVLTVWGGPGLLRSIPQSGTAVKPEAEMQVLMNQLPLMQARMVELDKALESGQDNAEPVSTAERMRKLAEAHDAEVDRLANEWAGRAWPALIDIVESGAKSGGRSAAIGWSAWDSRGVGTPPDGGIQALAKLAQANGFTARVESAGLLQVRWG